MSAVPGSDPAASARAAVLEAAHAYQEVFADRFVAAYALGSLAHGGYAPAVSDIDLAVVLTDTQGGDADTIAETGQALRERAELHRKLSVFWGSLAALRQGRNDGRFPAIDRLDLADHGLLLLGSDVARQVAVPTAGELLVNSAQFAVDVLATDEVIAEIHRPRRLLADPVWFTKAVLFPVRFFYSSAMTMGRAATNDEAIIWYLAQPGAVAAPLVRLAARVRAGEPLDPAAAAPLLAAGLSQLYQRYAEDQARRLRQAGAPAGLVAALTRWRGQLGD
ncbi:hypothetical protein GCM10022225_09520 [Plantactinospora mayteni]|uniref:Nucleotidyltransferase domain-containing protein n=1 Tax=Plantactinospora mayteni TaxID=566021 RepID=A0ABQ4EHT8_9ACTN|nr:hypothetical protein [Plantactinospora mayteni]GIG94301.1 hypothetical protein Pma05_08740 [Plantactinospora mayteni]